MPEVATALWSASRFGLTCLTLFMLANPIEALPVFLELTADYETRRRSRLALRASVFAAVLMVGSLLFGRVLLRVFGVSADAVMVAGGLVVMALAFPMLMTGKVRFHAGNVHNREKDHSLVPLAFPGICGPAAMAALISAASYIQGLSNVPAQLIGYGFVIAAIAVVCFAAWIILRLSSRIESRLGPDRLEALCRFMGLLLIVIGVQLLADGIRGFTRHQSETPKVTLPERPQASDAPEP